MGFVTISATGCLLLVIPLLPRGLICLGVPLLGIVGAGLATRSRLRWSGA